MLQGSHTRRTCQFRGSILGNNFAPQWAGRWNATYLLIFRGLHEDVRALRAVVPELLSQSRATDCVPHQALNRGEHFRRGGRRVEHECFLLIVFKTQLAGKQLRAQLAASRAEHVQFTIKVPRYALRHREYRACACWYSGLVAAI